MNLSPAVRRQIGHGLTVFLLALVATGALGGPLDRHVFVAAVAAAVKVTLSQLFPSK